MLTLLEKANENHVTVLTWGIGLLATALLARYALIPHFAARREARILDTRTWGTMLAALQRDRAKRYFDAISASTGWFDRVYGPNPWGATAFARALSFAFAYAILTLLIGWVLFDAGNLGGVPFLSEGQPMWQRAATLAAILVVAGSLFFVMGSDEGFKAWLHRRMARYDPTLAEIAHGPLIAAAVALILINFFIWLAQLQHFELGIR